MLLMRTVQSLEMNLTENVEKFVRQWKKVETSHEQRGEHIFSDVTSVFTLVTVKKLYRENHSYECSPRKVDQLTMDRSDEVLRQEGQCELINNLLVVSSKNMKFDTISMTRTSE